MNMPPLRLALVGHTNTGKTSLLRTLSRDAGFGEVSSRPGTTRHVEGVRLMVDGQARIELFDTPGMEDPIALLETLESMPAEAAGRLDGPARIERFLALPPAAARFEQEAKVLRQMLASDAALYVIDARDPVLAKYRDELAVLALCGIPLLPVLNFVGAPQADPDPWHGMLARIGLHAVARFDAVAPEREAEPVLYRKLAVMLDRHRPALEALIASREREAQARRQSALSEIAALLIDAAAARRLAPIEPGSVRREAIEALGEALRQRERTCQRTLLDLHRFSEHSVQAAALAPLAGRWQSDLFSPEAIQSMSVKLGTGAAAGAATGVGIDLMTGGITLGAAAAIGALAGGGWQTARHYGRRLKGWLGGQHELTVDETIVRLLALRQLHLLATLEARGHGSVDPVVPGGNDAGIWREGRLPKPLRKARSHPEWSSLSDPPHDQAGRAAATESLAACLSPPAGAARLTSLELE